MKTFISLSIIFFLLHWQAKAQQLFSGKITDQATQQPIANVTVSVNQTAQSVLTDSLGNFKLVLPKGDYQLSFKHLNFELQTLSIKLPYAGVFAVVLNPKEHTLQTVQVLNTGYQNLPKERSTGSFVQVSEQELTQRVGTTLISRLEGLVNGLSVDRRLSTNGQIMVRGLSTLLGPKDPLIVLDNFPYQGDLNQINPNDIESVTVLKDAAAASIWGARAGNGVIVITSKNPILGQPLRVTLNSNIGIGTAPGLFRLAQISPSAYIDVETFLYGKGYYNSQINSSAKPALSPVIELLLAQTRATATPEQTKAAIDQLRNHDVRNDFLNYMYRKPLNRQVALNLSEGTAKSSWGINLGYDANTGELASSYQRTMAKLNHQLKIGQHLHLRTSMSYTKSDIKSGRPGYSDIKMNSGALSPYLRFADDDGNAIAMANGHSLSYINGLTNPNLLHWKYYPLTDYLNSKGSSNQTDLLANINLSYNLFKGLKAEVLYQYQQQQTQSKNIADEQSYAARNLINTYAQFNATTGATTFIIPKGGILDQTESKLSATNLRGQLNYNLTTNLHSLTVLAGAERQEGLTNTFGNRTYGYSHERLSFSPVDYTKTYPTSITGASSFIPNGTSDFGSMNRRFVSFFGNAAYTYRQKYILNVSTRKDASNLFGLNTNDKWSPLWSAGVAWQLNKESFYTLNWLPELKLRATYGYSGNVDQALTALTITSAGTTSPYTQSATARFSQFANPELRWEKVAMLNTAIDFATAANRLSGSVEYYRKKSTDLYAATPVDYTAVSTASLTKNVAVISASGIDFNLNSRNLVGTFNWSTALNANYYKDKVLAYYRSNTLASAYVGSGQVVTGQVGMPIYALFSYRFEGLDPQTGDPLGYYQNAVSKSYKDIMGANAKISDLVYHGTAFPKWFGNINNTFSWKNLSLAVNVSYRLAYYFRRNSVNYSTLFDRAIGHSDFAQRWQKPGDELNTTVPSMVYPAVQRRESFYAGSAVLVERGDHLRLQYIHINYKFDKGVLKRMPFKSVDIYANAQNLGILWAKNKTGVDPDYRGGYLPEGKTIAFGAKIDF